jgi:hypothetical protein
MSEPHINFRVDATIKALVAQVAKARRERPSDFVRRALLSELARLSYLPAAEKKALGIVQRTPTSDPFILVGEARQ